MVRQINDQLNSLSLIALEFAIITDSKPSSIWLAWRETSTNTGKKIHAWGRNLYDTESVKKLDWRREALISAFKKS